LTQVDPESRPSVVGPAFTGHFRVTADTPRGLQPLYPAVPVSKEFAPSLKIEDKPHLKPSSIALSKPVFIKSEKSDQEPPAKRLRIACSTCSVDCSQTRYHCTKNGTINICPPCYFDGRFSSLLYSGDFLRMEEKSVKHEDDSTWSDQEKLALLEGIELYQEDWTKIAAHVGTRTKEQCLLQFLQLPIEDTYAGRTQESLGPLQYHRTPFTSKDNPILSLAALLASVVDPEVAKSAAEAAVAKLEMHPVKNEAPKSPTKDIKDNLNQIGGVAFGAAAGKAQVLASIEELEMQKQTRILIETQLKKMELKLQHFQEMEVLLDKERRDLERDRQRLFNDRLSLKKLGVTLPSSPVIQQQQDYDIEMNDDSFILPLGN
jgi:SWI/SNF related-matrix-associated actin-dependent regulator of chromatin subfamily C